LCSAGALAREGVGPVLAPVQGGVVVQR
jgi:hypothetical protein